MTNVGSILDDIIGRDFLLAGDLHVLEPVELGCPPIDEAFHSPSAGSLGSTAVAEVSACLGLRDAGLAADPLAHLFGSAVGDLPRKKGSAMDGRAAPTRSQVLESMMSAIRSGSVSPPTPTIGFSVASRTRPVHSSW